MIKSQSSVDNKPLNSTEQKDQTNKINNKHKTYIPKDKINITKQMNEDLEEEKGETYVEKIKIYRSKKNTSKMKEKPVKKLYHNEINKKENEESKAKKYANKIKPKMAKLNIINPNQTLDSNICMTDRAFEKIEDFRCITMAATPKKTYKNKFKNIISLNKGKKLLHTQKNSKSMLKNNYNNNINNSNLYHHRNRIKSNDFCETFSQKNSEFYLTTTQGVDNDLLGKFLEETSREINEPLYLKNNEINRLIERGPKTKREKSLNEKSFKEIIKRNDSMNNKYSSLRNSSQKGSLKNIKNNIHFFWNQNKLNNKDLNQKFNSSQKNLFTPKKMNELDNSNNLNSYKPLSKSKQNTNYLNRTFYYPKSSIKTKNNNFGINSTFCEAQNSKKLNIKKKLYIDPKTTNKYLAPIIESNIAIENENCHFLENTICGKNKIVKKVKNIYGEQTKENCATLRKIQNIIDNNIEKKNKKDEKNKNEKDKLLTEANKNANKLTFTDAFNKLNKKNQKNQEKLKSNNIKLQKSNNNNIHDVSKRYKNNNNNNNSNNNNNIHDVSKRYKNNNINTIVNNNNNNIHDVSKRYKNNINITINNTVSNNIHDNSKRYKNNISTTVTNNNIHDISKRYKSKNNNNNIHDLSKRYKNNLNINNSNINSNSNNVHNISLRYKNNSNINSITEASYRNNTYVPESRERKRSRSKKARYFGRAESIDISMSSLSSLSRHNLYIGKIEDYSITKELGKGSYAVVKLGMHRVTKQKYAIKIYTKESLLDPQKRNTVNNEINILRQLNHNNIMKLYEVIDSSKYLYLVLEYIKGVSLLEVIKAEKCHYIEQDRAIKLFLQIVKGVSYCQSKNINHRDIKLENILVLDDDTIKLIDFGFAVKGNKDTYQKLFCGTPSYMPPEIVNKEKYIAQYSDVWSLGVLLYTMLYGRFPFRAKDDDTLFSLINEGKIIFPENIPVRESIKFLIKQIINVNPKMRPSPEEIICEIMFDE